MGKVELKPCPFCGHQTHWIEDIYEDEERRFYVFCNSCGAMGAWKYTPKEAVEAWNVRSEPAYLAGYKDGYAVGKCEATFEEPLFHVSPDADGVFDG